jgi:8-oxo-dGTP pyrophosphatase MutT (NUDIX family)
MLERLIHRFRDSTRTAPPGAATHQAGVIPYALENGVPVFLLVTTRRTGRWIFPKGACEADETLHACAAREAFEEAGVEGEIAGPAIGAYRDRKHAARTSVIEVEMYPFHVTRQHDEWPESKARKRHWVTLAEARELITTPGLFDLAERADAQIRAAARSPAAAGSAAGQQIKSKIQ